MLLSIVIIAYLLAGLYFHPYSQGDSVVTGAILHVLWLPAVIFVYLVLRYGNRI